MIGNHTVAVIADAMAKGFDGFDQNVAWDAVYKSAMEEDLPSLIEGLCGYLNQGTPPEYLMNGYVSHECDADQSASMTLEYAYDDWCISRIAEKLGKKTEAEQLAARAGNYKNVWDPATGFMRGKHLNGRWVTPFDPSQVGSGNDFTEASAWIYSWFVPHDVPGLIGLMGGPAAFVSKLDQFFDAGHVDISNEPSFATPFLYNAAGSPAKAQSRARQILDASFTTGPRGLPGNDDSGAMSAWLVWVAMGLYPLTPGDPTYQITGPLFDKITLVLDPKHYGGHRFVIEAINSSSTNVYIQSATLNGETLDGPTIRHAQITAGGTLSLTMGSSPSHWGE
jgi:predicted alpha-1,2-mannosidase